mgnify:CR=1 FL=1
MLLLIILKEDADMRVVLTIVGKDKVGITAKVSNALAEMNINIHQHQPKHYARLFQYGADC